MYQDFYTLRAALFDPRSTKKRVAVAGATDEHALEAVLIARREGYTEPILIGDSTEIEKKIQTLGYSKDSIEIIHSTPSESPSAIAVRLVHEGRCDFILKGKMETKDLLKPILDKKTGLNENGFITHFGLMQLKGYHKLLAMSDSAVIPYPTLEDKIKIVEVGLSALRRLGYGTPIVGALCAVETISQKMPETMDADALRTMSDQGFFGEGIVVGPISYDLATQKEAAVMKGYMSPYAGNVDMLLVPNMVTGNVMSKIWNSDPGNTLAGCLIGSSVPIALTSRSASMNEKLTSILLCSLLSK